MQEEQRRLVCIQPRERGAEVQQTAGRGGDRGSPLAAGGTLTMAARRCPGYRWPGSVGAPRRAPAIRRRLLPGPAAPAPAGGRRAGGGIPAAGGIAAVSWRRSSGPPPCTWPGGGVQRGWGDGGEQPLGGGNAVVGQGKGLETVCHHPR